MVQYCPKCGTRAPDNESVFCNRCGTRLPPAAPARRDPVCPRCGARLVDEQSAFCNKCGFSFRSAAPAGPAPRAAEPPVPQPAPRPASQPVPAQPAPPEARCLSCGAPLAGGKSGYCESCLAYINRTRPAAAPAPAQAAGKPARPATPPAPVPDLPPRAPDVPEGGTRPWKRYLAIGIAAILVIVILAIGVSVVPGLLKGANATSDATPSSTVSPEVPATTVPLPKTTAVTKAATTIPTTAETAVPATTGTTNVSATGTVNASATKTANVTATVTANVTKTVAAPASNLNSTQAFSFGQGATDGKGKLTVNSITWKDKLSDPTPSYAIGKKYLIVSITYENLQNSTADVDTKAMALKDGGGYAFDQAVDVLLETPFNGKGIQPLETRNGNLLFIVPPQATFLKLEYDFGSGNIARFQIS